MMEFSKELRVRLLRLKKAISQHFSESNWMELGLYIGCADIIDVEDRLFRSLTFNDPDYDGHIISVLEKIARKNVRLIEDVEQYVVSNFSAADFGDVTIDGIFCKPKVFARPTSSQEHDLIALMIPFSAEFLPVVTAIKGVARMNQMRCIRANDMWEDSTIIQDIFSLIYRARIVICDFSTRNPNVFYEAGIAHALGRVVIPLAQSLLDVPFDLRHHRHLIYLPNEQGLSEFSISLNSRIHTILQEG